MYHEQKDVILYFYLLFVVLNHRFSPSNVQPLV